MKDDQYNPSHPYADWSGYVAPLSSKKHIEILPAQITSLSSGIGPTEEASNHEWKPSLRVIQVNESGSSPTGDSKTSSTFTLFGGPVPKDTSEVGSSHWKTEAQAAYEQVKTTVERRGKKSILPAYEHVRPFDESVAARIRRENPYLLNDVNCGDYGVKVNDAISDDPFSRDSALNGSLIGYRSHRGGAARSFLDGLGKKVAPVVPPSKHVISPAPYATDGDVPTDPYATEDGGRRKDLLLENYYGKREL